MNSNKIKRINEMFKAKFSFLKISKIEKISVKNISKIYMEYIMRDLNVSKITFKRTKERYYKFESDIEKELNLTYSIDDLKGDELKILNKLNE